MSLGLCQFGTALQGLAGETLGLVAGLRQFAAQPRLHALQLTIAIGQPPFQITARRLQPFLGLGQFLLRRRVLARLQPHQRLLTLGHDRAQSFGFLLGQRPRLGVLLGVRARVLQVLVARGQLTLQRLATRLQPAPLLCRGLGVGIAPGLGGILLAHFGLVQLRGQRGFFRLQGRAHRADFPLALGQQARHLLGPRVGFLLLSRQILQLRLTRRRLLLRSRQLDLGGFDLGRQLRFQRLHLPIAIRQPLLQITPRRLQPLFGLGQFLQRRRVLARLQSHQRLLTLGHDRAQSFGFLLGQRPRLGVLLGVRARVLQVLVARGQLTLQRLATRLQPAPLLCRGLGVGIAPGLGGILLAHFGLVQLRGQRGFFRLQGRAHRADFPLALGQQARHLLGPRVGFLLLSRQILQLRLTRRRLLLRSRQLDLGGFDLGRQL